MKAPRGGARGMRLVIRFRRVVDGGRGHHLGGLAGSRDEEDVEVMSEPCACAAQRVGGAPLRFPRRTITSEVVGRHPVVARGALPNALGDIPCSPVSTHRRIDSTRMPMIRAYVALTTASHHGLVSLSVTLGGRACVCTIGALMKAPRGIGTLPSKP